LISKLLHRGQVIPFLGAGANQGNRPAGARWRDAADAFLPTGAELSRLLAAEVGFPADDEHDLTDLPKVASYFVEAAARRRLRDDLREVFDRDLDPCDIHTYLANLPTPLLIVTTNYDDLTERAFAKANRPYDLVVHPTDSKALAASVFWWRFGAAEPEAVKPNLLHIDLKTTTVIYKMHGSVNRVLPKWDSYVVTEEDYVDFLARMMAETAVPALFLSHFRERSFLFLGYGLRDWNLRLVLKTLRTVDDTLRTVDDDELVSWAIQFRPSQLEIALWKTRGVNLYDVDINAFVQRLRDTAAT
jgi:hypothetical protein